MRSIVLLLVAAIALLAPSAAHAKGAAVTAAEVCNAQGCVPTPLPRGLDGLVPRLWVAATDGARHVDAPWATPSVRIRLRLDDLYASRLLDPHRSAASDAVEIEYAPRIMAVRIVAPASKGHWARVDAAARTALEDLTRGIEPSPGIPRPVRPDHQDGDANDTVSLSFTAGVGALALAGLGAAMAIRRRRREARRHPLPAAGGAAR